MMRTLLLALSALLSVATWAHDFECDGISHVIMGSDPRTGCTAGVVGAHSSASAWRDLPSIMAIGDTGAGGETAGHALAFDPADGETVDSLVTIVVFTDEYLFDIDRSLGSLVTVTDASGARVAGLDYAEIDCPELDVSCTLHLDTEITAEGEYAVSIPAGYLLLGHDGVPSGPVELHYTVGAAAAPGFTCTIDPADGSVLPSLSRITFSNDGEIFFNDYFDVTTEDHEGAGNIIVHDAQGNVVTMMAYIDTIWGAGWSEIGQTAVLGDAVTAEGEYAVDVPAGMFYIVVDGAKAYNGEMALSYTIGGTGGGPAYDLAVIPESGSTVGSLSTITLSCDEGIVQSMEVVGDIVVAGTAGNVLSNIVTVEEVTCATGAITKVVLTINPEITDPGTYFVAIPEGFFVIANQDSEAMTLAYTVDGATGIDGVPATGTGAPAVHTIDGQRVGAPAKGGIYIIDGRKVVVK